MNASLRTTVLMLGVLVSLVVLTACPIVREKTLPPPVAYSVTIEIPGIGTFADDESYTSFRYAGLEGPSCIRSSTLYATFDDNLDLWFELVWTPDGAIGGGGDVRIPFARIPADNGDDAVSSGNQYLAIYEAELRVVEDRADLVELALYSAVACDVAEQTCETFEDPIIVRLVGEAEPFEGATGESGIWSDVNTGQPLCRYRRAL